MVSINDLPLSIWRLVQLQDKHELGTLTYDQLTLAFPIIEASRNELQRWGAIELSKKAEFEDGTEIGYTINAEALARMESTINMLIQNRDSIDD